LVFVVNETALLNAIPGGTASRPNDSGSSGCRRCRRYSSTIEKNEKPRTPAA
jgi:hypothetical protein